MNRNRVVPAKTYCHTLCYYASLWEHGRSLLDEGTVSVVAFSQILYANAPNNMNSQNAAWRGACSQMSVASYSMTLDQKSTSPYFDPNMNRTQLLKVMLRSAYKRFERIVDPPRLSNLVITKAQLDLLDLFLGLDRFSFRFTINQCGQLRCAFCYTRSCFDTFFLGTN